MLSMISSTLKVTREREIRFAFTRNFPLFTAWLISDRWSPDDAPIKSKMVYASSKESIKRTLTGIGAEIQGTDYAEVSYEAVLEKVSKGRA